MGSKTAELPANSHAWRHSSVPRGSRAEFTSLGSAVHKIASKKPRFESSSTHARVRTGFTSFSVLCARLTAELTLFCREMLALERRIRFAIVIRSTMCRRVSSRTLAVFERCDAVGSLRRAAVCLHSVQKNPESTAARVGQTAGVLSWERNSARSYGSEQRNRGRVRTVVVIVALRGSAPIASA